jgi:hypothetical protein
MKYLLPLLAVLAGCAAQPLTCKPNGHGWYGKTSIYDTGNTGYADCPGEQHRLRFYQNYLARRQSPSQE